MEYIKQNGWLLNEKAINKILRSKTTKDYLRVMSLINHNADNMDVVDYATHLNAEMTAESLSVLEVMYGGEPRMAHSGYINARAGEWLFEVCYLMSVLGNPPYPYAIELGLNDEDIKSYQDDWRKIGIEPRLVKSKEEMMDEKRSLYNFAEQFLKEEGFYFSHCYWNLDDRVHKAFDDGNVEDPGIVISLPDDKGYISISSVVQCDDFCKEYIVCRNEAEVKAAISVLGYLIKNWHERMIELRDEMQEEIDNA